MKIRQDEILEEVLRGGPKRANVNTPAVAYRMSILHIGKF